MKPIGFHPGRIFAIMLAALVPACLWTVSPDDFNKITFVNNLSSGKAIEYLFYSPGDSQYWGPDVLDKNHSLAASRKLSFFIFYPDTTAKIDFMAVDSDGRVYEIDGVEMLDGKEKTVTLNDRHLTDRNLARMPMTEITVTNATDSSLDFAFLAPSDSKIWGLEVLNSSRTLRSGEETSFVVLLAGERFDMEFLAIGEDRLEYQKSFAVNATHDMVHLDIGPKDAVK
jgi:hypothetical protein